MAPSCLSVLALVVIISIVLSGSLAYAFPGNREDNKTTHQIAMVMIMLINSGLVVAFSVFYYNNCLQQS